MKLSRLAPGLYLLLTMTIANLLGQAEPTIAATDTTKAIAESSSPIAHVETRNVETRYKVLHGQNSLSQVSGDLAAVWTNHGVSSHGVVTATRNYDELKEFPRCGCPSCSEIIQEALSQVG